MLCAFRPGDHALKLRVELPLHAECAVGLGPVVGFAHCVGGEPRNHPPGRTNCYPAVRLPLSAVRTSASVPARAIRRSAS